MKLTRTVYAIQIHGITKQEVAECTLDIGTEYTVDCCYTDQLGETWQRINVGGYLYDIEPMEEESE